MQPDLIDMAEKAKREALDRVLANSLSFHGRALTAIRKLPHGAYTGEEIRAELIAQGIEPHSPNAWGALIGDAVQKGLLRETGRLRKMKSLKSHRRKTPEYVIVKSAS